MNVYKVIFARDRAIACEIAINNIIFSGDYMYERHSNGGVIYAFIKAESENDALRISNKVVEEARQQSIAAGTRL